MSYNIRTYSNGPNNLRNSSNYIDQKRASTIFTGIAANKKIPDNVNIAHCDNSEWKGNIASVGGFNVSSYKLFLDLSKGQYYTAVNGRQLNINNKKICTVQTKHIYAKKALEIK